MPRLPRIFIENAVYFVTCRGEHNENIFKDEKDYKMFLDLLKKYQEQYGIKVFAYCLLPDHLHLLVEMEKELKQSSPQEAGQFELSDFMRDLNNNYTKYFNGRYERKGHLFRERFKSAIVEKDKYLLKMTAYIHLNPEKLNLVKDAKDYAYSSYQTYLYGDNAEKKDLDSLVTAVNEALSGFGDKDYSEFIRNIGREEREFIHKKLARGGIVGSDDFVKKVKTEVEVYQAQGIGQKYEVAEKKNYKLFFLVGSILIILMVGSAGIYLFFINKDIIKASSLTNATSQTLNLTQTAKDMIQVQEDLKADEWDVKLTSATGSLPTEDVLTFRGGKFSSSRLNSLGFNLSNFTKKTEESGRVIWETMQRSPNGTAFWRGEIEQGKMTGILVLRQAGKQPQDFSFTGSTHRRRE